MILPEIVAGDTLDFVDQVADYPATAGWTLKYLLAAQFTTPTQASVTLTAATYLTTDYRVQIAPSATGAWAPGVYTWTRWVEKTGARQSLGEGRIEVRANAATLAQGYDSRTTAQKALADAEAALASFQSTSGRIKAYSIAGRSMEFDDSASILVVISYWRRQVLTESASKAKAEGRPDPRRVHIRMTNA